MSEDSPEVTEPVEGSDTLELLRHHLKEPGITKIKLRKRRSATLKLKNYARETKDEKQDCRVCRRTLADKEGLKRHMLIHDNSLPYPCEHCDRSFRSHGNRTKHTRAVHKRERPFECVECGKRFATKCAYKYHVLTHSGERPYKCEYCDKTFNRGHVLKSHMYTHTGEKPYTCPFCDYACRDNSTLRKHVSRHTGTHKKYECNICDKRYEDKYKLKMHIAGVHLGANLDKYQCDYCKKWFPTRSRIHTHIRLIHLRAILWECSVCAHQFTSSSNLEKHYAKHSTDRPFLCTHCPKNYKSKDDLGKHVLTHFPPKHVCRECGRGFHRVGRWRRHERHAHKARSKKTPCPMCNVKFYSQAYVNKHMRDKHNKDRELFVCDYCGMTALNKPGLVVHIKLHLGQKRRYKCEICNKRFRRAFSKHEHCREMHGVSVKKKFVDRIDEDDTPLVRIKEENIDIEEKPLVPSTHKSIVLMSRDATEEVAGEVIRQNCKRLSKIPESYFDKFYVKQEPRPDKIATPKTTAIHHREQPKLTRPKRNVQPVDYSYIDRELDETSPSMPKSANIEISNVQSLVRSEHDEPIQSCSELQIRLERIPARQSADSGQTREKNWKSKCAIKFKTEQCYTCMKLFPSRQELIEHCKDHFGLAANKKTIKKCPYCGEEPKHLWRHVRKIHGVELKIASPDVKIKVDKNTEQVKFVINIGEKTYKERAIRQKKKVLYQTRSKANDEVMNKIVDEIEVIPSVQSLNRRCAREIDKINRLNKLRVVAKRKLVRKGNEWVIENEIIPTKVVSLTDEPVNRVKNTEKEDLTNDRYLEEIHRMATRAKNVGEEILYPCNKCEKVCQNFSALTLHRRIHNSEAKPYKPKVWKYKLKQQGLLDMYNESKGNSDAKKKSDKDDKKSWRYEKPKPIEVKRYQCDYELMEFFKKNVTGADVDFEHFLKEYRKVKNKSLDEIEPKDTFGEIFEDASNDSKIANKPPKKRHSFKETMRKLAMRRRLIKAKLREKIALETRKCGTQTTDESIINTTTDLHIDATSDNIDRDDFRGFSEDDSSQFNNNLEEQVQIESTDTEINISDALVHPEIYNSAESNNNKSNVETSENETLIQISVSTGKIVKLATSIDGKDTTMLDVTRNEYPQNIYKIVQIKEELLDNYDEPSQFNNETYESIVGSSQYRNKCYDNVNENIKFHNESYQNIDELSRTHNETYEHDVEPSGNENKTNSDNETECNKGAYDEAVSADLENEMNDIMKLITDKSSNVQYEVVDLDKELGVDFNIKLKQHNK